LKKKSNKKTDTSLPKRTERVSPQEGDHFTFTGEHVKAWGDNDLMPQELVSKFLEKLEQGKKQHERLQKYRKNNPDAPIEQILKDVFGLPKNLSAQEIEDVKIDADHSKRFYEFLEENWLKLISFSSSTHRNLYKDVDTSEYFGVSHSICNSLYHLEGLLGSMKSYEIGESLYEAKGTVTNSNLQSISLVYNFQASSKEEADKILIAYKQLMITKGLIVWLGHWLMANKRGKLEYRCTMTDIMKLIADEDRTAFFSVKEKEEHWAITKILSMSKLLKEKPVTKKGTAEKVTQWEEQPLIEILGGEKEMLGEEKYPISLAVRVMSPIEGKKNFAPHSYHNNTVTLAPKDAMLAFKVQTRAGQLEKGKRQFTIDWDLVFKAGNLQSTAKTKKAVAKTQARKKLGRLKDKKIIKNWKEDECGVLITPRDSSKKPKSKEKTT